MKVGFITCKNIENSYADTNQKVNTISHKALITNQYLEWDVRTDFCSLLSAGERERHGMYGTQTENLLNCHAAVQT